MEQAAQVQDSAQPPLLVGSDDFSRRNERDLTFGTPPTPPSVKNNWALLVSKVCILIVRI